MNRLAYLNRWNDKGTANKCCCSPQVEMQVKKVSASATKRGFDPFLFSTSTSVRPVYLTSTLSGETSSKGGTDTLDANNWTYHDGYMQVEYSHTVYTPAQGTEGEPGYIPEMTVTEKSLGGYASGTEAGGTIAVERSGAPGGTYNFSMVLLVEAFVSGSMVVEDDVTERWTGEHKSYVRKLSDLYSLDTLKARVFAASDAVSFDVLPWQASVVVDDYVMGVNLSESGSPIWPDSTVYADQIAAQEVKSADAITARNQARDALDVAKQKLEEFKGEYAESVTLYRNAYELVNDRIADLDGAEFAVEAWQSRVTAKIPGAEVGLASARATVTSRASALDDASRRLSATPVPSNQRWEVTGGDGSEHPFTYWGLVTKAQDSVTQFSAQAILAQWLHDRMTAESSELSSMGRCWRVGLAELTPNQTASASYLISEDERTVIVEKAQYRFRVRMIDEQVAIDGTGRGGLMVGAAGSMRVRLAWRERKEIIQTKTDTLAGAKEKRIITYREMEEVVELIDGEGFGEVHDLASAVPGTISVTGPQVKDYPIDATASFSGDDGKMDDTSDVGYGIGYIPGDATTGEGWVYPASEDGVVPHYLMLMHSGGTNTEPSKYGGFQSWEKTIDPHSKRATWQLRDTRTGGDATAFIASLGEPTTRTETVLEWRQGSGAEYKFYRIELGNPAYVGGMMDDALAMMMNPVPKGGTTGQPFAINWINPTWTRCEQARTKWYVHLGADEIEGDVKATRREWDIAAGTYEDAVVTIGMLPNEKNPNMVEGIQKEGVPGYGKRVELLNFRGTINLSTVRVVDIQG